MDKLEQLFQMQREFDRELEINRKIKDIGLDEWVQKGVLALIAELIEVVNEVNYKWWKNPKQVNVDNLKEEMIDVLHFYISTCLKIGLTEQEVVDIFKQKNEENILRQKGLSQKKGYAISELNE